MSKVLGILEGLLKGTYGSVPTPQEMTAFEGRYRSGDIGTLLSFQGTPDELSQLIKQETFFKYYDEDEQTTVTFPCMLEYKIDESSGFPNSVTIVTNFGKAIIGGFTENDRGIPYPTKISFRAHNYLSKIIDYKNPLAVLARIHVPNVALDENKIDPFYIPEYDETYDPEVSLAKQEEYDPEHAFVEEADVDINSDTSNVTFVDKQEEQENKKADQETPHPYDPSFTKLFRYYIASNKIEKTPTLREHNQSDGTISYGPEIDMERASICMYDNVPEEELQGAWVAVTPSNSEADPRTNFEKWMLDFHFKCFMQCFSDYMDDIKNMSGDLKHFREN